MIIKKPNLFEISNHQNYIEHLQSALMSIRPEGREMTDYRRDIIHYINIYNKKLRGANTSFIKSACQRIEKISLGADDIFLTIYDITQKECRAFENMLLKNSQDLEEILSIFSEEQKAKDL